LGRRRTSGILAIVTRYPRADRPGEEAAVRTTIVGGRPPGSGTGLGPIPRGIEILVTKAAVDAAFRERLLTDREGAARSIELELTAAERAMLRVVPAEHLVGIIHSVRVTPQLVPAFLGRAAAVMLAALTTGIPGCKSSPGEEVLPSDSGASTTETAAASATSPAAQATASESVGSTAVSARPTEPGSASATASAGPSAAAEPPPAAPQRPETHLPTRGIRPDRAPFEQLSSPVKPTRGR
jgi:hypothetical protein